MELNITNEVLQWSSILILMLFIALNRINLNFINKFFKKWSDEKYR